MARRTAILWIVAVAFLAIAGPIVLVIYIAETQEIDEGKARAVAYATDILQRSEGTAEAFRKIVQRLPELSADGPCSARGIDLMEHAALASSKIHALGYLEGTRIRCSSLGAGFDGLDLGPPQETGDSSGLKLRTRITFPLTGDIEFVVLETGGYVGIVHEALPLSAVTEGPYVELGVARVDRPQLLLANSGLDPAWLDSLPEPGRSVAFLRDDYVVAISRSANYELVGLAAIPVRYLTQGVSQLAYYLVPVGGAAGVVLALVFLYFSREELAMPQLVRSALKRDEFFLVYQPIVDLRTGGWVGAEALLRWQRQGGEIVQPDLFVPVAEEAGLTQELTRRLLTLVARDLGGVFEEFPEFYISVNLSAADIHDDGIVAEMQQLQHVTGAAPGNLMVEVTERALTAPEHARGVIRRLRATGINAAVDDFGTGYSSLSYIESFDLDVLKIDKFFVDTVSMGASDTSRNVMLHIIEIARSLDLSMIAEGVETEAQKQFLLDSGVQYGQGWLFSKPMKMVELLGLLRSRGVVKRHLALID